MILSNFKSLYSSLLYYCVPLIPKMDRGSTGSGLTTAKRSKNQQAGNFRTLEPTTLVMGTCNSKPELSCYCIIVGEYKWYWYQSHNDTDTSISICISISITV